MKVKIYGAGSIGNHLANASRSLGWEVDICDIDEKALKRTKEMIYPSRYKKWDNDIGLFKNENAPKKVYDLICIGTPPDSHLELANLALLEKPKAILIEKPLCTPDLLNLNDFYEKIKNSNVKVFVGYDHVLGLAAKELKNYLLSQDPLNIKTFDVEFREFWGGIFKAHPWLEGPSDSYLGFSRRGGGAACEHSHGLNFWQSICHFLKFGRVVEVQAIMKKNTSDEIDYDELVMLNLRAESGFVGRVIQDVISNPSSKKATIQLKNKRIEWENGYNLNQDAVVEIDNNKKLNEKLFDKTRPDDFILELKHIQKHIESNSVSEISLERGIETMMVIAAAFKSVNERKNILIDYSKGYNLSALL